MCFYRLWTRLREKYLNTYFVWSLFSRMRTEYADLREIPKNSFFTEDLWTTASVIYI